MIEHRTTPITILFLPSSVWSATKRKKRKESNDCLYLLFTSILFLSFKDSVLHLQEEMTRLQENLEKLKVQGSEDDSDEKVTSNKRLK